MTYSKVVPLAAITFLFLCSACASRPASQQPKVEGEHWDPLEGVNREIYDFNMNVLDKHILRPVAVGYVTYVPEPVRQGADNLVRNLDEPSSAVNNLLQANWSDSAKNISRFLINSTVGIVGIFDVASHMGLSRKQDSFGEVLGKYGVGNGPYLMMPGMGPTTPREEVGDYVDDLYWPLATLTFWPTVIQLSIKGLTARSRLLEQEQMLKDSLDPYNFVKEAYFQNQKFKVYDGKLPEKPAKNDAYLDEFLDELE